MQREEEGWSVLAGEVKPASDELEQTPLILAKREAEDVPMVGQVPKPLTPCRDVFGFGGDVRARDC